MMRRRVWTLLALVAAAFLIVCCMGADNTAYAAPKPASVTISRPDFTMDMSRWKSTTLKATVAPSGASQYVTWKSSDPKVASITSAGRLTALKPGVTTITCTARGTSVKTSIRLTVINSKLPESLTITEETLPLFRHETYTLTPDIQPATASTAVTWKSSNTAVAKVSSKGVITAVNKGTCTITCVSNEGSSVRDSVVVTVTNQSTPKSIALSPADTAMYVGETLYLEAAVTPENACAFVTYTSSNTSVLGVSASGRVQARKAGTATIKVTSKQSSKVYAQRKITVVPVGSPLSIVPDETYITLNPGKTAKLTSTVLPETANQTLKYKSSNTSIVGVSSTGNIIGRAAGTATITIYSSVNSNIKATVKVKVANLPAPTSILISAEKTTLQKGETMQLVATPVPGTADARFSYSSSNTARATVSSSGVVTAKSGGYVTIKVTSQRSSAVVKTIKLFVHDDAVPTKITLDGTSVVLDTTQYLTLKVDVQPQTAAGSVKWTSSNTRVVGVSETGKLYARAAGTATITCQSTFDSSVKDTYSVRVVNRAAPTSISVSAGDGYVKAGETLQLEIKVTPSTASTLYTCTSSNTAVATVSNSGKILGVKSGTCTITVASKKNTSIKKSFTLRVYEGNEAAAIKLSTNGAALGVGDTMTVTATVLPATSDQTVTWKSSDTSVLTVTESGKIKGVGVGKATLTATSGKVTASATFTVMQTTMATTIPARTTDISGISANMARIEAIRRSAVNELMILRESGAITAAEYTDRVESVNRAFEMQAFPWMTTTIQEYWSTAYAYKRYKPGNVYYGLPYIQCGTNGVYTNRQYNVTKAVKQGYYTDSGKGYYNMSRTKFLNGMYVGNDCSAFVSMAMWGTSNNLSYLNTTSLATNAGYKTTYKWTEMRPGDFMVKSGNHTVMFLYYTDASRTKAMIIEQGGDGNTVICSIHDIATKYKNKGYIMRRKVTYK